MNYTHWIREFRITLTPEFANHFYYTKNDSPYESYYLKDFYGVMLRSDKPVEQLYHKELHLTVNPRLQKRKGGDSMFIDGCKLTLSEQTDPAPAVDIEIGTFRNTGFIDNSHLTLIQRDKKQNLTGYIRFIIR